MAVIPRERSLDSSLALLADGYRFVSKRCERHRSDIFQTRLLLQPVICMRGEAAARLFYDTERFQRAGAAPRRLRKTLLGQGGVQGLDGEAHRSRKHLLMALLAPERVGQLAEAVDEQWRAAILRWETMREVMLFDAVQEVLCRAVCQWAGVPLAEAEVKRRTRDIGAMIDGAGAVGLRHWRGRLARRRAERWIGDLIKQVRCQALAAAMGSALHAIAWHRDSDGKLLSPRVAAVELLNLLRPTVAIALFITFAALALHEHPECREEVERGDDAYTGLFVQEVRRFYPFFPTVIARTRATFEWNGYRFPKGTRVLLDLYGTNHDARLWEKPDAFRPERFRHWDGGAYNFIPQGGGEYATNHRCAGEGVTVAVLRKVLRCLTSAMSYEVPRQDLRFSLSRMPAIPRSRFVIRNVRRAAPAGGEADGRTAKAAQADARKWR